jgi:replicative DNA helicase
MPPAATGNGALPFSADAEKGVLSSLLKAPAKVAPLCTQIGRNAFHFPANGIIFDAALNWPTPTTEIDFVWLINTLRERGELEEAGGKEYLNDLYDFVSTVDNADYYIQEVDEKYALRQTILTCNEIIRQCDDPKAKAEEILLAAEHEISRLIRSQKTSGAVIEPGSELISADLPLPPELIVGVLHKTLKGQLAGASKSMKSWALIHLAIGVSKQPKGAFCLST